MDDAALEELVRPEGLVITEGRLQPKIAAFDPEVPSLQVGLRRGAEVPGSNTIKK